MTPIDLAVIIVSWNTRAITLQALQALSVDLSTSGLSARIILVDNASTDGSAQAVLAAFPTVEVIASVENLGFVGGNNLALRLLGFGGEDSSAERPGAVYLLNPDAIVDLGSTRLLLDALASQPDAGLVGANLRYADGSFQHGVFAFPGLRQLWAEFFFVPGRLREGRFNGRYPRRLYDGLNPFPVDFVLGATMMMSRHALDAVGLMDERYFMYCEEIDWAWRLRRTGLKAYCVPQARVVHLGGQSSGQVMPVTIERLWRSRLLLTDRYYPRWKRTAARRLIHLGMRRKLNALARQPLLPEERDALAAAYRAVIEMASA